ncbi:hypothetical protein [Robbsia andropogonis]|uniref:hypothetical protein n=1 Tax=Robbsia andropogonis TaxID=28092 RepID=UPI0020A225DC|nr:hypothetical protein [Robbsia andropogonis]MCP1118890.1 hypothetical protein [Robbsia andropogonis]MCP1128357.1 hypothetical protein [Robbsia andropogonis]
MSNDAMRKALQEASDIIWKSASFHNGGPRVSTSRKNWHRIGTIIQAALPALAQSEEKLNRTYSERNELAIAFVKAAIAAGWNAGKGKDNNEDYDDQWRNVVYVDLPDGRQVSWHIAPSELNLLEGLPDYNRSWDGTMLGRSVGWSKAIAPAQSEAKPVEFFTEIASSYPCPICNKPSATTDEMFASYMRARTTDFETWMNHTHPAPAGDGGKRIRFIDRAIVQEERACRVEDMLIDLVNQIRKTSPVDDHGHSTTMNAAYLKAVKYLDDATRHAPAGADVLSDEEIVATAAPYCDDSGWMNGDQIFAFARAVRAKRGGAS